MLIYPVFIQQRGCPFQCKYCDQSRFSSTREVPFEELRKQIERFCLAHPDEDKQIAFYGGTFTALPVEERNRYYQVTEPFLNEHTTLRLSTRPDFVNPDELNWCSSHHVRTIELGIQDFNTHILTESGRGYNGQTAQDACRRVTEYGFELGIQLMPGLPGFSPLDIVESSRTLRGLRPRYLRLYPVVVLKGTALWEDMLAGRYIPLSLDEAIDVCADYLELLSGSGITVIKVGIPPLEKDCEHAGPYHPALGELVRGELLIRRIISGYSGQPGIFLARPEISLLTGHQGYNMRKLMHRLDAHVVNVAQDVTLSGGEIRYSSETTDGPFKRH